MKKYRILLSLLLVSFTILLTSCGCEHEIVIDEAVESTCTEHGLTEGSHCSLCGEILVPQIETELKEHKEKNITGKAPSCEQEGLTVGKSCSVCGTILVEQETIPALGHTTITLPATEANCTAPGYTEGTKCTVCNKILSGHTVSEPAKGHVEEIILGYDATCTEKGLTDGVKCSICNSTVKAQKTIEALGHNEVEYGHCSRCNNYTVTFEQACSDFDDCFFDYYYKEASDYRLEILDIALFGNIRTTVGEVFSTVWNLSNVTRDAFIGEAEEIYLYIQKHPDKNKRVAEYAEELYSLWEEYYECINDYDYDGLLVNYYSDLYEIENELTEAHDKFKSSYK